MDIKKLNTIYFSPNGSTKEIANILVESIGKFPIEELDYTFIESIKETRSFNRDELMVVAFPVYADRLPSVSGKIFENIKGNDTPAIIVTSYGNRDYGDALLELKEKMEERGFIVISAAAIIGEHCLNTNVAKDRPDKADKKKIEAYGEEISRKLLEIENLKEMDELTVKGNHPYPPLKDQHTPTGDAKCIQCGKCEANCPVSAINEEDFRKTDSDICIFCGRCIQVCPTGARDMKDEGFLKFMEKLEKMTKERKEIEAFL